jgi:CspA family cold shock protein
MKSGGYAHDTLFFFLTAGGPALGLGLFSALFGGSSHMRETGRVKWFNDAKGFGFITRDSGPDVFVHHTAIEGSGFRTLAEDQEVEFEVVQGAKGLQAQNVVKI